MSEEELEAIAYLRKVIDKNLFLFCNDIRIVLNLITKQQKKIEKQDKMIDLMGDKIQEILQTCPYDKYDEYLDCENKCKAETEVYKECWKEYFRKKVEEDAKN